MSEISKTIKRYARLKNWLYLIDILFVLLVLSVFYFSGLSENLALKSKDIFDNYYFALLLYFLVFSAGFYLVGLPLEYYESHIIERQFNLSNQSASEWFKENIKKSAVSLVISLVLIVALYFFIRISPAWWWFYTGIFWFLFNVILGKLLPVLILPLFYKQTPLKDEDLKERLFKLAEKAKVKIENIYEIDMSKQTKKANAALVGSGKTRRILLADTLLQEYDRQEIEAVLAHELAHHKLNHFRKLLLFGGLLSFAGLYIVYLILMQTIGQADAAAIYNIANMPVILIALMLFMTLSSPLQNAFTRHLECRADMYSLNLSRQYEAFKSAMQKLTRQNLSDPEPSRFIEIMLYDHPPVSKRIKLADKLKG